MEAREVAIPHRHWPHRNGPGDRATVVQLKLEGEPQFFRVEGDDRTRHARVSSEQGSVEAMPGFVFMADLRDRGKEKSGILEKLWLDGDLEHGKAVPNGGDLWVEESAEGPVGHALIAPKAAQGRSRMRMPLAWHGGVERATSARTIDQAGRLRRCGRGA